MTEFSMEKTRFSSRGFSLIEILVVIAIIFILAGIAISGWQYISEGINLKNAIQTAEIQIKLARNYSLSALNDSNYGIHFEAGSIILFKGNSYTAGDPNNTVYSLASGVEIYNIALGGTVECPACTSDLVFNRLTGSSNSGTFSIRLVSNPSKSAQLNVNDQGQVGKGAFQASLEPVVVEDIVNNINARHIHFNLNSWTIKDSSPVTALVFRKSDNTLIESKPVSSYFSAGIFNWEGTVNVDSVAQTLRIHTLDSNGTTLCIIRDRMQNNKSIKISFMYGGYEEKVVSYTESGANVIAAPGSDVILPIIPQ